MIPSSRGHEPASSDANPAMCRPTLIRPLLCLGTIGAFFVPARGASAQMLTSARNEREPGAKSSPMRVVVSVSERRLWAIAGDDTLLAAPVAVAKGTTLEYAGHEYTFKTPRGTRQVLRKE